MSERLRESLSALMDGEANELELQRLLTQLENDEELRQTWVRYNAVRSVVSGQESASFSLDISQRVRVSIEEESSSGSLGAATQRLLKPFASFAVAASVAAVVVVGGQQLSQVGDVDSSSSNMTAGLPAIGLNSLGATSVRASLGSQQIPVLAPASPTAYRELARNRMQKYMQEHVEHAALNSPQGLVPFARVKRIEE